MLACSFLRRSFVDSNATIKTIINIIIIVTTFLLIFLFNGSQIVDPLRNQLIDTFITHFPFAVKVGEISCNPLIDLWWYIVTRSIEVRWSKRKRDRDELRRPRLQSWLHEHARERVFARTSKSVQHVTRTLVEKYGCCHHGHTLLHSIKRHNDNQEKSTWVKTVAP